MPQVKQRDPEATARTLERWLAGRLMCGSGHPVVVSGLDAPVTNGFSSETLLFDVSGPALDDRNGQPGLRRLVVRVRPTEHSIFPDADFEVQFRVMAALGASNAVPVPAVLWYEADPTWLGAPFYAMERVEGLVATDNPPYTMGGWVSEASVTQQEQMWWSGVDAMAAVHRVDWRALGLDWLPGHSDAERALDQQLSYYRRFAEAASLGQPPRVVQVTFDWLDAHRPRLGPLHSSDVCTLCWGDARLGNMIFRDFACAAVLDWEMSSIGPPELDVGWWLWFDRQFSEGLSQERPAGFGSRAETLHRYEATTGRTLRDLEWFERFAGLRFAVILVRLATLLKGADILEVESDFERNNLCTQMLAADLGLPHPSTEA